MLRRGQHRAAIAAAGEEGVEHLFYTSVIGVDDAANPAPIVPDHRDTEAALRESGLRYTRCATASTPRPCCSRYVPPSRPVCT